MKLWSSVRQQAGKLAFEAERMVRIKKEEGAIDDARKQIASVHTSLGQVALSLYRAGSLDVPQVAALAKQVAELESTIAQHEEAIVQIRAEQPPATEADQPEAPIAAPAPGPAQPSLAPMAPAQPEQPAMGAPVPEAPADAIKCANCGAALPDTGAFCPECGTRIG